MKDPDSFASMYQNQPYQQSHEERFADLLWSYYHYKCERYDSTVCTTRHPKTGAWLPTPGCSVRIVRNGKPELVSEMRAIDLHSQKVLRKLEVIRLSLEISDEVWKAARFYANAHAPSELKGLRDNFLSLVDRMEFEKMELPTKAFWEWFWT